MRAVFLKAIAISMLAVATPIQAAETLTLTFSGQVSSQFDYVSHNYEALSVPSAITVTATIPLSSFTVADYGATTIAYFFPLGQTIISDPLLAYIGNDPVGNGLGDLGKSAYAFSDTNDYTSVFLKEFAFQDNIYHYSPEKIWSYHTEIRLVNRLSPLTGDGTSDFALTPDLLVPFLTENIGKPIAYYNTSWEVYKPIPTGGAEYIGGKSWSSSTMALTSFQVSPGIPEPSTWSMLILGFGFIGAIMRTLRQEGRTEFFREISEHPITINDGAL